MPRGKRAGGVNKMEAVRQVIAKHGKETMPVEIVRLAKAEHGAILSADVASNYKSAVLRKLGLGAAPPGKRGPKPGWKKAAAATSTGVALASGEISLDDIAAVKKLVDELGAEKVKQLAQVLAR